MDRLRQSALHQRKQMELAAMPDEPDGGPEAGDAERELLLFCCHPALAPRSRVALALKTAGGFGVGEIARAFLADPAAVTQMLTRARRTLREHRAGLAVAGAEPPAERVESALEALYLLFNEGYSASSGDRLVRHESLCGRHPVR
jgi:RNA polymerase sigma-70 factor (ECF subfamily)